MTTENWCELFKTGTHKDSNGKVKTYTNADLDTIVNNFNKGTKDVPVVIGHPTDKAPAYAWVDKLKTEGGKLFGTFKDAAEEFKKWVNEGRYKQRSVSLYGNGTLRHVGFLGAVPPAIKGLEAYQFSADNEDVYEFTEGENLVNTSNFAEQIATKDAKIAELEAKIKANETKTNDFAEEQKTKDAKIAELEAALAKKEAEQRKSDFENFCEECIKKGAILPKQKANVMEFLEAINGNTYNFSEGDNKSVVDKFKEFVGGIKQIKLTETAKDGNKNISDFNSSDYATAIELEIAKNAEKGVEISYEQAARKVKGE